VLDPDPRVRTATLRALTESPARRAGAPIDEPLLTLALAAEVVGFAVLVEATGAADSANSAAAGAQPARATHDEGRDAIERIGLLLSLLYPARYPACLRAALPAENGRIEAAALEYLDNALDPPYRQLLVSCLERWNLAA
jgi:hypothetical protein